MHYIWPVTYIHHDQTVATSRTCERLRKKMKYRR